MRRNFLASKEFYRLQVFVIKCILQQVKGFLDLQGSLNIAKDGDIIGINELKFTVSQRQNVSKQNGNIIQKLFKFIFSLPFLSIYFNFRLFSY